MHQLGLTLTIGATLGNRALAATSPHRDTVDDIALLGLVPQPAGLVGPGWPWSAMHLDYSNIKDGYGIQ